MKIKINGKIYQAEKDETILEVCQRNGIKIPTLCHFEGLPKEQVCRLCLVETNQHSGLVPSCGIKVKEGLEVATESEEISKARRINLELLWSDHAGKCSSCYKNRNCELQKLAEEYKIENFHFVPRKDEITKEEELDLLKDNNLRDSVDTKNPCIEKKGSLCVECRRCINVCPVQEFGFNFRAGQVKVGKFFGESLDCIFCGKCVEACPVASLVPKSDFEKQKKDLCDPKKMAVAVVDPKAMQNLEKSWGRKIEKKFFLGILRKLGFERIFSLELAQSKFQNETLEFVEKSKDNYIFSSKNLSFNLYIQKYYLELEKNLIKADFPEVVMVNWIKKEWSEQEKINSQDIKLFFITPQLAKKKLKGQFGIDHVLIPSEVERLQEYCKIEKTGTSDFDRFILDSEFVEKKKDLKTIEVKGVQNIKKVLSEVKSRKAKHGFYEFYF